MAKTENCIKTGIDDCAETWSKYENVDIKVMNEWRVNLKSLVKEKISRIIEMKRIRSFGNPISLKTLNRPDVKDYLLDLHQKFVLVPTDKAQNNISIVCKKFYLDSLLKEVSFSMDEKQVEIKANTYIQINNSVESIIQRHCNDVKRWKANITDDQKQLPSLYWTPKMHKHPPKQRFIAGSSSCSTKSTSAMITLCLKLIQKAHKIYCDRIKSYTGFNFTWFW